MTLKQQTSKAKQRYLSLFDAEAHLDTERIPTRTWPGRTSRSGRRFESWPPPPPTGPASKFWGRGRSRGSSAAFPTRPPTPTPTASPSRPNFRPTFLKGSEINLSKSLPDVTKQLKAKIRSIYDRIEQNMKPCQRVRLRLVRKAANLTSEIDVDVTALVEKPMTFKGLKLFGVWSWGRKQNTWTNNVKVKNTPYRLKEARAFNRSGEANGPAYR